MDVATSTADLARGCPQGKGRGWQFCEALEKREDSGIIELEVYDNSLLPEQTAAPYYLHFGSQRRVDGVNGALWLAHPLSF